MGSIGAKTATTGAVLNSSGSTTGSKQTELERIASTKNYLNVRDWIRDNMKIGDIIEVEQYDGKMYPYKLIENNEYRSVFEANLPSDLASETNGYVKTGDIHYLIANGRRKWKLR